MRPEEPTPEQLDAAMEQARAAFKASIEAREKRLRPGRERRARRAKLAELGEKFLRTLQEVAPDSPMNTASEEQELCAWACVVEEASRLGLLDEAKP